MSLSRLQADEVLPVLKVNGDTYTNVTVTRVTATDIYFISSLGMGNAKLKTLDPELQKHFHYDSAKGAAEEHKQAANQAQAQPRAQNNGKKIWANSLLNQKAPELVVEKWLTDEPDRRGKFVLIDFWATWCPPCRAAIPELNAFQKKFGDKLVVVGISDESEFAVRRMQEPKIDYAVAIDTQGRTKGIIGVTGIPHVLLIDPQGYVRWEGFPFLEGYELNEKVVADVMARFAK